MTVEEQVLECVCTAYRKQADEVTLETNINRDLSGKSVYTLALISGIRDKMGVKVQFGDARRMRTVQDWVDKVVELQGN